MVEKWWKQNQCFAMAISVSRLQSPIENTWSELKRADYKRKPKDMKDLEMSWMGEWSLQIYSPTLLNIIEIGSVLLSLLGGGCTKYEKQGCQ